MYIILRKLDEFNQIPDKNRSIKNWIVFMAFLRNKGRSKAFELKIYNTGSVVKEKIKYLFVLCTKTTLKTQFIRDYFKQLRKYVLRISMPRL